MTKVEFIVYVLCLVVLPMVTGSTADSATLMQLTSDPRPLIPIQKLAYRGHGSLAISLFNVSVTALQGDVAWTGVGFIILSQGELQGWISRGNHDRYGMRTCILQSPRVQTLSLLTRRGFNESFPVYLDRESWLLFANCLIDVQISMAIHAEFQLVNHRSPRDYQCVVPVFLYYSIAYLAVLCTWGFICNPNKRHVLRIHSLMSALILIKALDLIFAAMKMDARPPDFYVLSGTVHNLLFYIIEALIGFGLWKSLSSLHQKVRAATMITVLFQVFANVVLFSMGVPRSQLIRDFEKWNLSFLTINLVCYLPVITLTVWSIRLQEASEADNNKAWQSISSELRKLLAMYITAMAYLHFLFLFVFAQKVAAKFGMRIHIIAEEGVHLVMCMTMLYLFRPVTREASDYQNILENDHSAPAAAGKADSKDSKFDYKLPDYFYAGFCFLAVFVLQYFLLSILQRIKQAF